MASSNRKITHFLHLLQIILWLLLLYPISLNYSSIIDKHIIASIGVILSSCLLLTSIVIFIKRKEKLKFSITDILIIGYIVYIILNALFVRPYPVSDFFWLNFLSVVLVYISVRLMSIRQNNIVLLLIAFGGFIEAILVILQNYGMIESKHLLFNNTGSFFNPGLVGGFLAFSLCTVIYFFLKVNRQITRIFFLISTVPLIYALILTNSRAGWLAAFIGMVYLFWYSENKYIVGIKEKIKGSLFIKLFLIAIIIGGLVFIYLHKKSSADGRLFIWENSVAMVKDNPMTGHGIGMFREKYPYYQADYFINNPDSNRSMVAGNPSRAFNEYFSVLTTQGLIGFFFLIAIFFSIFIYKDVTLREKRKRAFLLSFCVFAFFSYPTAYFRLLILLPFFTALLPSIPIIFVRHRIVIFTFMILISLGTFSYGVKMIKEYNGLLHSFQSISHTHSQHECCQNDNCDHRHVHDCCNVEITDKQYEKIKYDPLLFQNYYNVIVNKLNDEEKFILTKEYVELYPSSQGFCELGRMYKERKNYQKAKDYFTLAYHVNPSLITPNYELFLLYQEMGDMENMIQIGNKALNQTIKREGTETLTLKANIKNTLNNLSTY